MASTQCVAKYYMLLYFHHVTRGLDTLPPSATCASTLVTHSAAIAHRLMQVVEMYNFSHASFTYIEGPWLEEEKENP